MLNSASSSLVVLQLFRTKMEEKGRRMLDKRITALLIAVTILTMTSMVSTAQITATIQTQKSPTRNLVAPPPETAWSKAYGGAGVDYATSVQQTSDGGFVLAGVTTSFGAGGGDFCLVKTNSAGDKQWNRTYGGTRDDLVDYVEQTSDGGYILTGCTWSFGAGSNDFWLVKTDSSGNLQWNKTYGGPGSDWVASVHQTADGGYILIGQTNSSTAGDLDFWLAKTDSSGNLQWNKTYGGSNQDGAHSGQQTSDGGYIMAGATISFGAGDADFLLVKTDSSGNMQWNKTYGGSGLDSARSVQQTADGGYMVAGYTDSFGAGSYDFWLVKTDSSGNQQWNKTYGGSKDDSAWSFQQTSDGGYIIAGFTFSFGAGSADFWVVKTDSSGNMQWNKTYGGISEDGPFSVRQTSDGGYVVAGYTNSFGAGYADFWLVKIGGAGTGGLSVEIIAVVVVVAVAAIAMAVLVLKRRR